MIKFIKNIPSYLPKRKAEHCLKYFKEEKIEIFQTDTLEPNEEQAKKDSIKKYFTVNKSNKALPIDYIKYLMSIDMKEDPTKCIENTLPYLVVTLAFTLILALIFSSIDLYMKKIIFFSTSLLIWLPLNYIFIRTFYDNLHTTKNSHEDIYTYIQSNENNKDNQNKRILLAYRENTIEFGKIYPYFMGAYFAIIITFTFYSASLMPL